MGYTHCYTIHDLNTDLRVPEIAQDISRIIMASEIPIGGIPDHDHNITTEPVLGPSRIIFNGVGDEACEDFSYPPDPERRRVNRLIGSPEGWDHCETSRKTYDHVLCAAFITLKHHLGDNVKIESDGKFNQGDWQIAHRLYRQALRRELPQFFHEHEWTGTSG